MFGLETLLAIIHHCGTTAHAHHLKMPLKMPFRGWFGLRQLQVLGNEIALHVVSCKIQFPMKDMGHSHTPRAGLAQSNSVGASSESLESSLEEEDSKMGWDQVGKHSQQMCP